jgi:electron transfer flavoprotein alpha subunit
MPLATDCLGIDLEGTAWSVTRQLFGGKINAKVSFNRQGPSMATIRSGAFQMTERDSLNGQIIPLPSPLSDGALAKRFLGYLEAASAMWTLRSGYLVAVGRGIKGVENIPMVKEFANALVESRCSDPWSTRNGYRRVGWDIRKDRQTQSLCSWALAVPSSILRDEGRRNSDRHQQGPKGTHL